MAQSWPWGSQIADKKDKYVNFDVKPESLCKAVNKHCLLSPILNQEESTAENLNFSQKKFFCSVTGERA